MSYAEHLDQMVAAMARLAVRGCADLDPGEFDLALTGRGAVLELLATLHHDLTGIARRRLYATAAELESHPVAALSAALRFHPRPTVAGPPSDILQLEVTSAAGRLWRDVARHAMLATHEWATGQVRKLDDAQAWAGTADVAAVTGLLTHLDRDLAAAVAQIPGRGQDARCLSEALTSGLRLAARETSALAASGPLAPRGPDRAATPNRVIVRAGDGRQLVAAHHQLAALLRTAGHVRPERIRLMATSHLRTCQDWAAALARAPEVEVSRLAADVGQHALLLREATFGTTVAASLEVGDALPLRQAGELRHALNARGPTLSAEIAADPDLARGFVAALADTTRALAETADRHLAGGAWIRHVDVDKQPLTWTRSRPWHEVPRPFLALRAAAVHSELLTDRVAPPAKPSPPGPRQIVPLLDRLRAERAPARPTAPGVSPSPRASLARTVPHRR